MIYKWKCNYALYTDIREHPYHEIGLYYNNYSEDFSNVISDVLLQQYYDILRNQKIIYSTYLFTISRGDSNEHSQHKSI